MCSSGGPMAELSMKKLKTKKYKCLDNKHIAILNVKSKF